MARAKKTLETPRLDEEQVRELLALTRAADSVELKLTVSEEHRYSTLTALDARTMRPIWTGGLGDPDPRGISIAPDGRRGYVVHLRTPRVSVVDLSNGRVVERLSIPS